MENEVTLAAEQCEHIVEIHPFQRRDAVVIRCYDGAPVVLKKRMAGEITVSRYLPPLRPGPGPERLSSRLDYCG